MAETAEPAAGHAEGAAPMRIVVIGTSGAGKTTLARAIARQFRLPHIELDAINWQPGWHDIARHDPPEFIRRVAAATQADAWVLDGNYSIVREQVWQRATHLVWLDYARRVVMARVIRRSVVRAILRTELWAGNREQWRHFLHPSHPIRWAWTTWAQRRRETAERLAWRRNAGLVGPAAAPSAGGSGGAPVPPGCRGGLWPPCYIAMTGPATPTPRSPSPPAW